MGLTQYTRKNFARGRLAIELAPHEDTIQLNSNHTLPMDPNYPNAIFKLIIWDDFTYLDPADDPNVEIVDATWSGTPDVFNVVRAQESTRSVGHGLNSMCYLRLTAAVEQQDVMSMGTKAIDESEVGDGKVLFYNQLDDRLTYRPAIQGVGYMDYDMVVFMLTPYL